MIGYLTTKTHDVQSVNLTQAATIGSYTPKNKKCFCYPYCFIKLTNHSGDEKILKWENFKKINGYEGTITLDVDQCPSQSPLYAVTPKNYEGLLYNNAYIVQYSNFPQLPWNYNAYQNWFALNSNSILFGFLGKGISTAVSAATGNAAGALSGAVSEMSDFLSLMDKQKQPEQTRGTVQGNYLMYSAKAGIFAQKVEAKTEYIVMIDEFFSHYGYSVNETKVPTFHKRPNFDYIKTRDINIVGDIPNEDIEELENIFNDGVTVWHNINTYGDYNVNNAPT